MGEIPLALVMNALQFPETYGMTHAKSAQLLKPQQHGHS